MPTMVSLFTGAMGLDLGLEKAGFRTAVAVECNREAIATIRTNRPEVPLIDRAIGEVKTEQILEAGGLDVGTVSLLAAGPSCQSFSTAGTRGSLKVKSGLLLYEFIRVVKEAQPDFFILENVRGLLSAAIKHRPLRGRGPGCPPLDGDEELGSAFRSVAERLRNLGYSVVFDVLNAADFGVSQTRHRLVILGSRDGIPLAMPAPSHNRDGMGRLPRWRTLRDALKGLSENEPEFMQFVPSRRRYFKYVPPGGNWRDLPDNLKAKALGGAYQSWGGRSGFLRRLSWDHPSPTLNTNPDSKATALCHPDELRPLTVKEYARIQGFPDDWQICGGIRSKYRQLGNAVPLRLAEAIGESIIAVREKRPDRSLQGKVECHNLGLLNSLVARRRTRLNPPRMRQAVPPGIADPWDVGVSPLRDDATGYVPGHLVGSVGKGKVIRTIVQQLKEAYGSPDLGNYLDPIDELFFILLSQRTTGPSYERVFRRFKKWIGYWDALPRKRVRTIAKVVADGGLSTQKARHAVAMAKQLREDFGRVTLDPLQGKPDEAVETYLTSLPGIGVKTAKCVMLFSMNRQVLPVDSHVGRFAERVGIVDAGAAKSRTHEVIEAVVPAKYRYDFHVNVVAHGRAVCRAPIPKCGECPVSSVCVTRSANEQKGKRV